VNKRRAGGKNRERAAAHGQATFEAIVRRHGATVLRVCRALVDPADADDAWSDTFLAAMRARPTLPADANVEAWLVTIAHRKAIDILRASSRRAVPVDDPPDVASHDDHHLVGDQTLMEHLAARPTEQHHAVVYLHRPAALRPRRRGPRRAGPEPVAELSELSVVGMPEQAGSEDLHREGHVALPRHGWQPR
jgi:hypothetical protein